MPDDTQPSQAARDAAETLCARGTAAAIRNGNYDQHIAVQAFAQFEDRVRADAEKAIVEPTEEMWGGLARDIMMWLDMSEKTPRALFKHLERSGRDIPQWLRDEPEMKRLDHVPSKGTRCVIIWKAMNEARDHRPILSAQGEG